MHEQNNSVAISPRQSRARPVVPTILTVVDPEWLEDQQQEAWIPFVQMLLRLPSALDSQLQRDSSMTHFEYIVLVSLSMVERRRLRLRELADIAGSSLPRLSNVITRMEKKEWVMREGDPDDRRSTFAVLTEEGVKQAALAAPGHVAAVRGLVIDQLSAEQLAVLGEASRLILHAIDPKPSALGR